MCVRVRVPERKRMLRKQDVYALHAYMCVFIFLSYASISNTPIYVDLVRKLGERNIIY